MKGSRKPLLLVLASVLLLALNTGCTSNSKITRSYVDPTAANRTDLKGVLVVGIAQQQKSRVEFENAFAKSLGHHDVRAVASHTLVPALDPEGEELIAAAEKANLDMVLVTRFVGEKAEDVYHPGTIYYGVMPAYAGPYNRGYYGGYYGHAYEMAYDQPVWTTNKTYTLISDLFITDSKEHMWQAVSDTMQAGSEGKLRDDIIKGFVDDLKAQDLLD